MFKTQILIIILKNHDILVLFYDLHGLKCLTQKYAENVEAKRHG